MTGRRLALVVTALWTVTTGGQGPARPVQAPAAPGDWLWGNLEAGQTYPTALQVSNACAIPVTVSIDHDLPMLQIASSATVAPHSAVNVPASILVPGGAEGAIRGHVIVSYAGSEPACLPSATVYLVSGHAVSGGGRGAPGAGPAPQGLPAGPAPGPPAQGGADAAINRYHEARDLADAADEAQRAGNPDDARALAAKAQDSAAAAGDALDAGVASGDIGEALAASLARAVEEIGSRARAILTGTPAPAPAPPAPPVAGTPPPAGGSTTGGGAPAGGADPTDAPPPTLFGEDPGDGVIGVLLVRDDDEWVPSFRGWTTVVAKIYEPDPAHAGLWLPSADKRAVITTTFVARSSEPGRNMNTRLFQGPQDSPDLYLNQGLHPGAGCYDDPTGQLLFGTCRTLAAENEFTFTLTSRDDGAYSRLDVSCPRCVQLRGVGPARFGSGGHFPLGVPESDRERRAVYVPRDDNRNQIADGYDQEKIFDTTADADQDDQPAGNGTMGDGLSAYEEYRGFLLGDDVDVSRTSWRTKDLFVENTDRFPLWRFRIASRLHVHQTNPGQHDARVINFSAGHAHLVEQHGLVLRRDPVDTDLQHDLGATVLGAASALGPPRRVELVRIFADNFRLETTASGRLSGERRSRLGTRFLADTVAHELGHAVGIRHHGDTRPAVEFYSPLPADPGATRPRNTYPGTEICGRQLPGGVAFGHKHDQASGDVFCLMRYPMTGVAFHQADGTIECIQPSPTPDQFCTSPAGTGYNAGDRVAGDAALGRGDCMGQLVVNDASGG